MLLSSQISSVSRMSSCNPTTNYQSEPEFPLPELPQLPFQGEFTADISAHIALSWTSVPRLPPCHLQHLGIGWALHLEYPPNLVLEFKSHPSVPVCREIPAFLIRVPIILH
jgi:hypothetical protein